MKQSTIQGHGISYHGDFYCGVKSKKATAVFSGLCKGLYVVAEYKLLHINLEAPGPNVFLALPVVKLLVANSNKISSREGKSLPSSKSSHTVLWKNSRLL